MKREAVVWNYSYVDALKGTVLHRTVPRHRVDGEPISTYAEWFHTEPFQSPVQTQPYMIFISLVLKFAHN